MMMRVGFAVRIGEIVGREGGGWGDGLSWRVLRSMI